MSIIVDKVSKIYGSQKALNEVSFEVKSPEIVGFLGPNGAGKSTMMKILTTYITSTSGQAIVNGFSVQKSAQEVQQSVGYLPEHNPLYLDMYVKEYLSFNAKVYNIDIERINEVIEQTGLSPESHKKIGQLSKGYRQRVGLANALLHDPEVLILDEPTTGLDPNQLVEIRNLIKSIGKTKTVFLSTHIMQEVEAMCDRVIIINKGEIVADQSISELRHQSEQIINVEFDNEVPLELLQTLPHLNSVSQKGNFVYELSFKSTDDMRSYVFDFAQTNELKILELHTKNSTLEELFRALTASSNPEK